MVVVFLKMYAFYCGVCKNLRTKKILTSTSDMSSSAESSATELAAPATTSSRTAY